MSAFSDNPFHQLPAVHQLLEQPLVQQLQTEYGRQVVLTAIRSELDRLREHLKIQTITINAEAIALRVAERVKAEAAPFIRTVINATGIVLHTNLGRSPIAEEAALAAYEAARSYS